MDGCLKEVLDKNSRDHSLYKRRRANNQEGMDMIERFKPLKKTILKGLCIQYMR